MESLVRPAADSVLWLLGFGAASGASLFARGFVLWRRGRTIEDTPTAKVRSMPLGRVELAGVARSYDAPLRAPLSGTPCVWFQYRVERESGTGRKRHWRTVDAGASEAPFALEDDTGRIRIEPRGAAMEIAPQLRETDPELAGALAAFADARGLRVAGIFGAPARLRITEARLHEGDPLYVHGVAQARPGLREERRDAIRERLAALKQDEKALVALDADEDGAISAEEWDVARLRVVSEVEATPVRDGVVVGADPLAHAPFLVASHAERQLVASLRRRAVASVLGGALPALACLWAGMERFAALGRM